MPDSIKGRARDPGQVRDLELSKDGAGDWPCTELCAWRDALVPGSQCANLLLLTQVPGALEATQRSWKTVAVAGTEQGRGGGDRGVMPALEDGSEDVMNLFLPGPQ